MTQLFIVELSYNEDIYPITHTFGPYSSWESAEAARIEFITKMDDAFGDWTEVWNSDVKPIRSFDQTYARLYSELNMWIQTEKDDRTIDQ